MSEDELIARYVEKFGEEPVFTGVAAFEGFPFEAIYDAIESGVPYNEDEVPEGIDI